MELAFIICALLGVSFSAQLPDSQNRVNPTKFQEELLTRTNRIVADKLVNLTIHLEPWKARVSEIHQNDERMANLTIERIEQLQSTRDKEAECFLQKKQFQNRLRLFAASSAKDGFQQSLAAISRKIEASMENLRKQNTLNASDSDKIPRNPADERDFLYEKMYDLKSQMMRETTNITVEYFHQAQAKLESSEHIMNEMVKQMITICGTTEPTAQPEVQLTDQVRDRLQRLAVEKPIEMLVRTNASVAQMNDDHKAFIEHKLHKLLDKLASAAVTIGPPCYLTGEGPIKTSWGEDQIQTRLREQLISQCHDGYLDSLSKSQDKYNLSSFLKQFRAPTESLDEFNKVMDTLDYKYSVFVSLEQNQFKLEYIECMDGIVRFIIETARFSQESFLRNCASGRN